MFTYMCCIMSDFDPVSFMDFHFSAIAMLPQEDRASLERAKQTAPQVFETESDPLLFLR